MNEIYDLLEWQKVWDWASKTTLAPFLLSQTPLREQIEQEGITDALGMTTWHSQFGGAMDTYAQPFRCFLNKTYPTRGGVHLWGSVTQGADPELLVTYEPC